VVDITCSNLSCHFKKLSKKSGAELTDLIPTQVIDSTVAKLNLKFRHRIFTPFLTLFAFLSQIFNDDPSCKRAVLEVNLHLSRMKKTLCSFGTSSLCKAKAKLPIELFQVLFRSLNSEIEKNSQETWNWKHGRAFVVDGTGFSMLDTPSNRSYFNIHNAQRSDIGFPVGRLLAVFSLSHAGILKAVVAPWKGKGTGELTLLNRVWDSFQPGDTLVGDALYSSYWIIAKASKLNIHFVGELRPRSIWKISKKKLDQVITIKKESHYPFALSEEEYDAFPPSIKVRIIKLVCAPKGFRPKVKYILTTHLDVKVSSEDICELYKQRWQVEINLRSLKTVMGMDILRGLSHEMVKKEVFAHLLAYNLTRLAMARAAKLLKRLPQELSFRCTMQVLNTARFAAATTGSKEPDALILLMMLASSPVGNRPDRYEPRVLKRRKKNFAYLDRSREEMRKILCKKYTCKKSSP
jgi:IS4 transposase